MHGWLRARSDRGPPGHAFIVGRLGMHQLSNQRCLRFNAWPAGCPRAVIVGRLGMHQLGAVGLSNMVFFFVTVFFSFLLVVTTPRVADALAAGDAAQVLAPRRPSS
jgi:hypothetical protein